MNNSRSFLYETVRAALGVKFDSCSHPLTPSEKAQTYIEALFLLSAIEVVVEKHWLLSREPNANFGQFVSSAFTRELAPVAFLAPLLKDIPFAEWKSLPRTLTALTAQIASEVRTYAIHSYRSFIQSAVFRMDAFSSIEGSLFPLILYRAFDAMDVILGVRYELDLGMASSLTNPERLYEGAGIGVQTPYSTILTALRSLQLRPGAHIVDLGSGYGRLGLMAGLWRADLEFSGYEFVEHRVEVSNVAAEKAGLSKRVQFFEQNLADLNFQIPLADVYYMYDPFCENTYRTVLGRLQQIAYLRPATIVTKGNAGNWFRKLMDNEYWSEPELHDGGTLQLFQSLKKCNLSPA